MKTAVVALVASLLVMVACSSPETSSKSPMDRPSEDRGDAGSNSSGGSKKSDGGGVTTDGGGEPIANGVCSGEPSFDACWTCCEDRIPEVAKKAKQISKDWQTCSCQPGTCATECASDWCINPDPDADWEEGKDAACIECLEENTDDCDDVEDQAWDALEADPIYAPAATCGEESGCDDKPGEDD